MDNQSAIAVSKNPEHHSKMKHLSLLDVLDQRSRMWFQEGLIGHVFVSTQNMATDIFTKALD